MLPLWMFLMMTCFALLPCYDTVIHHSKVMQTYSCIICLTTSPVAVKQHDRVVYCITNTFTWLWAKLTQNVERKTSYHRECIKILSAHYSLCEWIVSRALPLQNTWMISLSLVSKYLSTWMCFCTTCTKTRLVNSTMNHVKENCAVYSLSILPTSLRI